MSELERAKALQLQMRLKARRAAAADTGAGSSADTASNRARLAAQGATLGFGDELSGAIVATIGKLTGDERPWSDIYTEVRDAERGEIEQFREERPGLATGLEIGGGAVTGGIGGLRAAGTNLARRFAAMPIKNRMLAASATGAAAGAAGGAGTAETVADIPREAAVAAIPGAVLGPVAEGVGTAAGALWRARPRFSTQEAAKQAVARGLRRSDLTPQEAGGRLSALGPGATLADVGEGTAALLERTAQQPGRTPGLARRTLGARSRRQVDELTEPFGPGRVNEMMRASRAQREAQAGPLYREAYAQGVENTERLRGLLENSPAVRRAWSAAKRDGQDWLAAEGLEDMSAAALGDAEPSLLGWRAINSKINGQIGKAVRAGDDEAVSRLTTLRNAVNAELDAQNPIYARARGIWSDSKSFDDAAAEGQKFLNQSASDVSETFRSLGDAEKAGYKVGVAQAIQDRLFKVRDTGDATGIFRTRDMREKLRLLFDDPRDYADAMNRIEAASAKQRTMNQALANSRTAYREALKAEESVPGAVAGAVADVATGSPMSGVASQGLRGLARSVPTSREATRDIVGQMLLEQDPQTINRMLVELGTRALPYQRPASALATAPILGITGAAALPPARQPDLPITRGR